MAKEPLLSEEQSAVVKAAVQRLRASKKNQDEVAKATGLSQQTISKILRGVPVGLQAAKAIALATGDFDVADLLGPGPTKAAPQRTVERHVELDAGSGEARQIVERPRSFEVEREQAVALLVSRHGWRQARAQAAVDGLEVYFQHTEGSVSPDAIVSAVLSAEAAISGKAVGQRVVTRKAANVEIHKSSSGAFEFGVPTGEQPESEPAKKHRR